jgi:hypothetical protein
LKAILHIENELSRLCDIESSPARQQYIKLSTEYIRTIGSKSDDPTMEFKLKSKINSSLERIDKMNLGSEHLFRGIGKLFEMTLSDESMHDYFENLTKQYAELLIAGEFIN